MDGEQLQTLTPAFDQDGVQLFHGDARHIPLEDGCVQTCVTSPPYFGLRDYGVAGQIGLEPTPDLFVAHLVEVFREVRRVLADDGTVWLNIGDSYAGSWSGNSMRPNGGTQRPGIPGFQELGGHYAARGGLVPPGCKPKDLIGIPWMLAKALRDPYHVGLIKRESDRAWLAALIDGEGCICIRRYHSHSNGLDHQRCQDGFIPYIGITNNDVELLERCKEITGIGSLTLKQKAATTDGRGIVSRRDSYSWRVENRQAIQIIRDVYPYLVAKRKQAILAFTLSESNKNGKKLRGKGPLPVEEQEKRERLKALIHDCNQRRTVDLPDWCIEPRPPFEDGWYLRSDIIWHKPNPMPESVTDRPTRAHETVFLLSKQERYFYNRAEARDALRASSVARLGQDVDSQIGSERANGGAKTNGRMKAVKPACFGGAIKSQTNDQTRLASGNAWEQDPADGANWRDVWTIAHEGFDGAHFAVMPTSLAERCIRAGSRPGDLVLDPFNGSGTTGAVALKWGRRYVGIELNADYIELSKERFRQRVLFGVTA